jgi:uncharacterized membrane protein YqjE
MSATADTTTSPGDDAREREPGVTLNPLRVIQVLRSAGDALFAQASLHGQLMRVEWAAEKSRLTGMLIAGMLVFIGALCFLLFVGALALAFSWDTPYRMLVAGLILVAYAALVIVGWLRVDALAARADQSFAATREELAADIALVRSRL